MRRYYSGYLRDMIDAIQHAQRFIGGMTFEQFASDDMTLYATERSLEILGEAAKRVPDEVRSLAPEIPWKRVAGMRDVVAHQYDRLDLGVIWKTVHEDLPRIESCIIRLEAVQRQREEAEANRD